MKSSVGVLTYLVAFSLLPAWFWIFQERIAWRFDDSETKERDLWLAGSTVALLALAGLIWRFLLPAWWKSATLDLMG
ncbi:MAG: hypothetical protein K2Y20_06570 [Sphingomonas sp.]|nr:hypothetical protein [Sphingomonas sp.]